MTLLEFQVAHGFRPITIERNLRVFGDSLRRIAETGGDTWRSEVLEPLFAAGKSGIELGAASSEVSEGMTELDEEALLALYRAHQARVWTANIIGASESILAAAGLHSRLEHPPAMCFLDMTGYTRLTQERGDAAAADLATSLARVVERTSLRHGGRPIKWLGDGVMFFFPRPGPGVIAALEMVAGVAEAGLPPAHVGLHAGSVVFQEGDYYGQTVNVASRIAEYARPGEVLVSQEVVDAASGADITFREIGPVELKGVGGAMRLHARPGPSERRGSLAASSQRAGKTRGQPSLNSPSSPSQPCRHESGTGAPSTNTRERFSVPGPFRSAEGRYQDRPLQEERSCQTSVLIGPRRRSSDTNGEHPDADQARTDDRRAQEEDAP